MRPTSLFALLCLLWVPLAAPAQERVVLGFGRIFTNDVLGDGHDRWRSGSSMWSLLVGPADTADLPHSPGVVWEYRLRTEIISPYTNSLADRPYVGALGFGVHTHAAPGPFVLALGLDAIVTGPQTGIARFQDWFHDLASLPDPIGADSQLPDAVHLGSTAEIALPLRLSPQVTLRPFVEAQAGVEDLMRVGVDVVLGHVVQDDILIRDPVTGHLLRGTESPITGLSLVAGADWARVGGSVFLPPDQGFVAQQDRWRGRAGLHWQATERAALFYGLTWLSPEFEGQPEGQTLGSLRIDVTF